MSLSGHYFTLRQHFSRLVEPGLPDDVTHWEQPGFDHHGFPMLLCGAFAGASAQELVIVLHGLGGSISSRYMVRALRAARAHGISCLLLNARGAGNSSGNIAHAGLVDDLALALSSESLRGYERVYLLGYSMGGHVALRYASHDPDPRVRSVAALCSPLDLAASMRAFDRALLNPYRTYVLGGLTAQFARYARSGRAPISIERARRIRRIFEWDRDVVAPVFGFDSPWAYYEQCSAANALDALVIPALYVGTRNDPMIPYDTVASALERANPDLSVV
ncbi:MAG TPA: alpha/beta fold hydrolase, partial [Polyangiaceae bacterium]|nr:alpha/beta fold hydrolase [Polyangiaceae bacterium]